MARKQKRTKKVEDVRSYVEGVAKNLVEKLYGPEGLPWGTKLSEVEELFLDIREVLTEKMLDLTLSQQAASQPPRPEPYRTCPSCHEAIVCEASNERIVQTQTGETEWSEPEGYCRKCRRAFFPSVQESGD
jgi:hypothetical protein